MPMDFQEHTCNILHQSTTIIWHHSSYNSASQVTENDLDFPITFKLSPNNVGFVYDRVQADRLTIYCLCFL